MFFSVAANNNTPVSHALLKDKPAATATRLATSSTSVNRLPESTEMPDPAPKDLLPRAPDGNTSECSARK